jgi:Ran GTPase-activating protein (RanGAP) involved in mRNA processing and transport
MGFCKSLKEQENEEEIISCQLWLKDEDAELICDLIHRGKVKKMALANNCLGVKAAEMIAETLVYNTTLEWLSLSGNKWGDEGTRFFLEVLEKNTTLKTLFLCNTKTSQKVDDELWTVNGEREKPLTENLYGLVLDSPSPEARARAEKKKEEELKKGKGKRPNGLG